LAIYKSCTCK